MGCRVQDKAARLRDRRLKVCKQIRSKLERSATIKPRNATHFWLEELYKPETTSDLGTDIRNHDHALDSSTTKNATDLFASDKTIYFFSDPAHDFVAARKDIKTTDQEDAVPSAIRSDITHTVIDFCSRATSTGRTRG